MLSKTPARLAMLLFCLLLLGLVGHAANPAPKSRVPAKPNVILITLDTTRADRMGFLGSERGLTPNLDKLAAQSVAFTHAYSQVPITTASHAVILSGTYSQFNHVDDFGVPLGTQVPYLPAVLRQSPFLGRFLLAFEG